MEHEKKSSTLSSSDEVAYYEPRPSVIPTLKEELASSDDEIARHQPDVTQEEKPLPCWVKQLYDHHNPTPTSHEQNADGPWRSQRIEEQRRASAHIVNIALLGLRLWQK